MNRKDPILEFGRHEEQECADDDLGLSPEEEYDNYEIDDPWSCYPDSEMLDEIDKMPPLE